MKSKLRKFASGNEFVVLIILLIVMTFFSVLNPSFITLRNMFDLLRTMIVTGIFACGLLVVIINGGIDMSFMAIAICSAYITIQLAISLNYNGPFIFLAVFSCIVGLLFGMINAFLINKFEIPIFIITLSVATIIRGFMLQFVGNEYVASSTMPASTITFSKTYWFNMQDSTGSTYGLHFSVFIMLAAMIITHLLLQYTTMGRGVYAIGGDLNSAQRVGYNISRVRMFIYGYAGLMAGLGGIIYVSNNRMADPMAFQGEELSVIAAVVMGGASISGGKGTVIGTLLGLMLTNVINNNLALINVPSYWQKLTFGMLIIFAVLLQSYKAKRAARVS